MSRKYLSIQPVIDLLRAQIQGIRSRPGIAAGLPKPLAVLEADLERLESAEKARVELAKAALAATEGAQRTAFDGRSSARMNLKAAARLRGKYSPDLTLLGGKPRRGGRRASEASVESAVGKTVEKIDEVVA